MYKNKDIYLRIESNRTKKKLKRIGKKYGTRKKVLKRINKKNYEAIRLMNFFVSSSFGKIKILRDTERPEVSVIQIPRIFSFNGDPESALVVLEKFISSVRNEEICEIIFDFSNCQVLDICASTVLSVIVMKLENYRPITLAGNYPPNYKDVITMLTCGLVKHLGIEDEVKKYLKKSESIGLKSSESIVNSQNNDSQKNQIKFDYEELELMEKRKFEKDAPEGIIGFINRCLQKKSYELNLNGKTWLSSIFGEVIDNSIQHGKLNQQYYCLGYFFEEANSKYGECSIVIFNFGNTITEAIKSSKDSVLKSRIKELVRIHKPFFSYNWSEDGLYTLYALQDGVSSKRLQGEIARGTGTVKMIEALQKLGMTSEGNEQSRMSLTSGYTSILFNGTYKMEKCIVNTEERDQIAFNPENDLNKKPDSDSVRLIKKKFPGTIIGMKFFIDKLHLKKNV